MRIVSVVFILDTWEICLVIVNTNSLQSSCILFSERHSRYTRRVKTASNFFGQVFVYKILSKSPMYHKSKQHRQYTLVLPVAPIVYGVCTLCQVK